MEKQNEIVRTDKKKRKYRIKKHKIALLFLLGSIASKSLWVEKMIQKKLYTIAAPLIQAEQLTTAQAEYISRITDPTYGRPLDESELRFDYLQHIPKEHYIAYNTQKKFNTLHVQQSTNFNNHATLTFTFYRITLPNGKSIEISFAKNGSIYLPQGKVLEWSETDLEEVMEYVEKLIGGSAW